MKEEGERRSHHSSASPAASSAGASSPAIPVNISSIDRRGLGKGHKRGGGSLSRNETRPSLSRLGDKGDLLRRIATFSSSKCPAGKSKAASPVACARRGWVYVDEDFIACEECGAQLTLFISSSCLKQEVEEATNIFSARLDSEHQEFCPWKGNPCAESLVHFPPPPFSALVEGFSDRCDALLQLSVLPIIATSAVGQMKLTKAPELDWLLSQPPLIVRTEEVPRTKAPVHSGNDLYYQAQQLISLCGWEPRFISNAPDCEEHSAHSVRNGRRPVIFRKEGHSHKISDPGPSMLPRSSRGRKREKKTSGQSKESKGFITGVVLDCNLCGESVGLSSFVSCARVIPSTSSTLVEMSGPSLKFRGVMIRGGSAASGVNCGGLSKLASKEKQEPGDEIGDGVVTGEKKIPSCEALDSNLAAGEPLPTVLGFGEKQPLVLEVARECGSEKGFPAASYESFGPCTQRDCPDDGGSTVDRPQSRAYLRDGMEGTLLNVGGEEADASLHTNRGRICIGESSRAKYPIENSVVDQFSQGTYFTDPGSRYLIPSEIDGINMAKRARSEQDNYDASVIAINTTYSKEENSMESVEKTLFNVGGGDEADASLPTIGGSISTGEPLFADQLSQGTYFNDPGSCYLIPSEADGTNRGKRARSEQDNYDASVIAVDTTHSKEDNSMESVENILQESGDGPVISREKSGITEFETFITLAQAEVGGRIDIGSAEQALSTNGASHEAEMHGADVSVNHTESVAGDAELTVEITVNQCQTSESVLDQAFSAADYVETPGDNTTLDIVNGSSAFAKYDCSVQGESWASEDRGSRAFGGDRIIDRTNGVADGGESYNNTGHLQEVVWATTSQEGQGSGERKIREREYFDPISRHSKFCPWVNGQVASAGDVGGDSVVALCGWQLTLDALYALRMEKQTSALPMESESAASMHKVSS